MLESLIRKLSNIPAMFLRNIQGMLAAAALCIICIILLIPSFSYIIGDVFFGKIKPLYNASFAQFFYIRSAYPLLRIPPPRYAHYQLSRTYFVRGDLNTALDEARMELEVYPDDSSTYYILGLTYGYMGRTHQAIDAFSSYIEANPDTWAGRNDKAWLQFRIGDIDGALETMQPIAENFKSTPWVQNTLCALFLNKKRYIDAKKSCDYAKETVDNMTPQDWGHAYPGNDPRVYATGLQAMRTSVEQNLKIIDAKINEKTKP